MSYSITISGHTRNQHNDQIKAIAEEAYAKAAALHDADEQAPGLSGWSGDATGSITLATPVAAAAIDPSEADAGDQPA